jgi:hypothetical protein
MYDLRVMGTDSNRLHAEILQGEETMACAGHMPAQDSKK